MAATGLVLGVLLAAYILWTPPGFKFIIQLQGRYFLPALGILAILSPPFLRLNRSSRVALAVSATGCVLLSAYFTVRMLDHYYFPRSTLLEKNIHDVFTIVPDQSSSEASEGAVLESWLDWVITGTSTSPGKFRVLATTEDGAIVGESDPALAGADFPYVLRPGSSRSRWRLHVWFLKGNANMRFWLVRGNSACSFGSELHFTPIPMPDA